MNTKVVYVKFKVVYVKTKVVYVKTNIFYVKVDIVYVKIKPYTCTCVNTLRRYYVSLREKST